MMRRVNQKQERRTDSPEELEFQIKEEAKIVEGTNLGMHAPSILIGSYTRAFGSVSSGQCDCQVFVCSIDFIALLHTFKVFATQEDLV